ncbi:exportin-6-A-like [Anthonomus grandis grandis]|uniref:exportin-6-A-like n=1 Tax=Anthonomus grandis grandis TaxID=2921223 RepID=UPI002166998A|nr:exportin-6-A-like [Anthonomus grandis grandis]XP_050298525.1 exportin-6-A-like [Anthonomus grandis grandis]
MNFNETDSLAVVERLFNEFFNPYTNNVRKQEIEMQLSSIQSSPHLGKLCLYFISHTSSHYVTMFALQNLESVINQHWSKTDWCLQEEIKTTLQTNLIFKCHGVPHFLRNKYAKLLVDVAKIDWPHRYPGFFDSVLELMRSESSNQIIGLVLTKTVFEEFTGINTTFETLDRKKEIVKLLSSYLPALFDILTNILDTVSIKSKHSTTTTPPPSPTNQTQVQHSLANQISQADFHSDARLLAQETLSTIQQLFSWVSIEKVPGKLLKAIFRFMGCSMNSQDEENELCVSAISTINELFYKNCSPRGTEGYFRDIYNHIVEILRSITSSTGCMDSINEMFVKKLCELLVLLLEQHSWRLEEDPAFTLLEFLSIFFQFSMHLSNPLCFLSCLSVWSVFFKQIKPTNAQKYSEVSVALGSALIKKIQFSYNFSQLVDLNTTEVDENNKTDLQYFINSSVDIVSQAANFAPFETFSQTLNAWNIYDKEVERCSEIWTDHHTSSNAETEKLAYILRDFSTLTFTLASLAHHFYSSENEDINNSATPLIFNLMENTLKSASNYKKTKSYVLRCNNPKLTQGFIDLQSELLNSLKTWLNWMEYRNQQCGNLDVFLKLILPILIDADKTPVQISMSAAQLLLELARRPNSLCPFTHLAVSEFIREVPSLKFLSIDVTNTVNSAVCDILLKHLKSFDQETLQRYKLLIGLFFNDLTRDFRDLVPNTVETKVHATVQTALPALSHVIDYCRGFPVIAKKELTLAIKPTLDHALLLFPVYVKYAETHNVFSQFFMSVLKNLQSQIGAEFTKNAMHIFLQVAVGEQQSQSLEGMQHLLEIFCTVINEKHNKNFLPEILQLCMESIYPFLLPKASENPDVFSVFLQLLYSILDCHWLYFYNTQVSLGYSPGGCDVEVGPDLPKKPDQLLALLKVFGEALLLDDLNIFRQSLLILQELNKNKKLYHKGLFRSHLLPELLRVLLNTLLYKRQGISNEDIILAVYNMAEVDFNGFFSTFLPHYIQSLDGVTPRDYELLAVHFGGTDLDVPSFMQHLQNFAADFQHLRKCNS